MSSALFQNTQSKSRPDKVFTLGVIVLLLISGCMTRSNSTTSSSSINSRFAIFPANYEQDKFYTQQRLDPNGEVVFIAQEPLIKDHDVYKSFIRSNSGSGMKIEIELTIDGSEVLQSQVDTYLNRFLAIQWDGRIVCVPYVASVLHSKLIIKSDPRVLPDQVLLEMSAFLNRSQ